MKSQRHNLMRIVLVLALATSVGLCVNQWLASSRVHADQPRDNTPAEWPTFRGNSAFQGVAPGKLPDKLELAWTFKTEGPVKSSAVIGHGRAFVGSDDYHVYAIDLNTGEEVWKFRTQGPVEAAPLLVDGMLFVGSTDGILYALDAHTGAETWRYETEDKIVGSANYWRTPNANGKAALHIIIGSYDFRLRSLDATTGKPVWEYETEDFINGGPAVDGDRIVFGGCDMKVHIVSAKTGEKIASVDLGAQIAATVALYENHAYIGHYGNAFECIDLATHEVKWSARDRSFPIMASAAVTDTHVYFGSRGKRLLAVQRQDGELAWTFRARGAIESSPVVCGNRIVVGSSDGRLYLINADDGKELWSYDLGQPIIASPAVARGHVIIGCEDGNVYAFGESD